MNRPTRRRNFWTPRAAALAVVVCLLAPGLFAQTPVKPPKNK